MIFKHFYLLILIVNILSFNVEANIFSDAIMSYCALFDNNPEYDPNPMVNFALYTSSNPINETIIDINNTENIRKSFDINKIIKIIIHGFNYKHFGVTYWMENMKNNYLTNNYNDTNVIIVNWNSIGDTCRYVDTIVPRVKLVGEKIANFLGNLTSKGYIDLKNVHLIGHSLGAHVAGFAGLYLNLMNIGQIERITGLDPAKPKFNKPNERLNKSCAKFVDIIHTSIDEIGIEDRIGHADYYPNSGSCKQPGCFGISAYQDACAHSRAHELMTDSIKLPNTFVATKCDSWDDYKNKKCKNNQISYMGENAKPDRQGVYFLDTNDESPFGNKLVFTYKVYICKKKN